QGLKKLRSVSLRVQLHDPLRAGLWNSARSAEQTWTPPSSRVLGSSVGISQQHITVTVQLVLLAPAADELKSAQFSFGVCDREFASGFVPFEIPGQEIAFVKRGGRSPIRNIR